LICEMGLGIKPRKPPVLIVLPLALIDEWKSNLEQRVQPMLKVCVYHDGKLNGKVTTTDYTVEELENYDVVLTTYTVLRNQFDRAGIIANPDTKANEVACKVQAEYRVAMTGTPLLNEYTDVHGLLKFLRIEPWDRLRIFKDYFLSKRTAKNTHARVLSEIRTTLLAATLLAISMRLKITDLFDGVAVVQFEPPDEYIVDHDLDEEQTIFQTKLKHIWDSEERRLVELLEKDGLWSSSLHPHEVFPAITNAKLTAVHVECARAGYGEVGDADVIEDPGARRSEAQAEAHRGHQGNHVRGHAKKKRQAFRDKMKNGGWGSPRMKEFLRIVKRFRRSRKAGKMIIFSEYLCTLDVAEAALEAEGCEVLRFDGWSSQADRERALALFEDGHNGYDFLLMTSRSGGLGLNLAIAKGVFHLTPCWNPVLTAQCTARAVRPGQDQKVQVWHFIVSESLERYIREVANVKKLKANRILDP
ncbi:P-loop containing nucleoside triphosphate hydrolase protein, partial [Phaeosphaeria sp. MPI-PUGE-AT-0046c]